MTTNKLQWKIGGEAGFGIMTTGQLFSKICTRGGLHTFAYPEYPSLIRGGHNTYQVHVDTTQATSQIHDVHLLVALNKTTIDLHITELVDGAAVIYDPADFNGATPAINGKQVILVPVELTKIVSEHGGSRVERNTIAIGASFGILGYPLGFIEQVIRDWFGVKKQPIANSNIEMARIGYEAVAGKYTQYQYQLEPLPHPQQQLVISGNRAIALGALQAGMKLYAAYPMTPSSDLLTYLAKQERAMNIVVKHTEDEIAAMNMIIGAGFAGVRAMTGTSGGGFALMAEALGMAGMAEVPIVTVMGQRPGPSTGMPTWSSQGDLRFVLHASQGEYPMIVLTPGDIEECFYLTFAAFNLAEQYQLPVIILVDKYVQESWQSVIPFATEQLQVQRGKLLTKVPEQYLRYQYTNDGVSPRVIPGVVGGRHITSSYEHDETSATTEAEAEVVQQQDKRLRKLDTYLQQHAQGPTLYGPTQAEVTVVGWGSTKLPALETLRLAEAQGVSMNYLHFTYIAPLPVNQVQAALTNVKKTLLVEGNKLGQFEGWLREHTGIKMNARFHKYGGRPFFPEEIIEQVKQLL